VSEAAVRDVVARLVPQAGADVRLLSVSDFSTWEVGGELILRFAFDDEGDAQLRREAAALPVLGARLPLRVPRIELLEEHAGGHLVMGYQKLRGAPGEELRPPRGQQGQIIEQLAEVRSPRSAASRTCCARVSDHRSPRRWNGSSPAMCRSRRRPRRSSSATPT
jgi:hypothetical protein